MEQIEVTCLEFGSHITNYDLYLYNLRLVLVFLFIFW